MSSDKEEKKVKSLMAQYPYVEEHYREFCAQRDRGESDLDVRIVVQRADFELMYRHPDNVQGDECVGPRWLMCEIDGQACVGTRHEYGQVILSDQVPLEILPGSMRTNENVRLGQRVGRFMDADVAYILWVRVFEWFAEVDGGAGVRKRTELFYEVHGAPKSMTFVELAERADLTKNVKLTTRAVMHGSMRDARLPHGGDFTRAVERVQWAIQRFASGVWHNGLSKIVESCDFSGMSGNFNGVTIMSFVSAGRVMISVEMSNPRNPEERDFLSFVGEDPPNEPRFGLQGIGCTVDRAVDLIEQVVHVWGQTPVDQRDQLFAADKGVRTLGT